MDSNHRPLPYQRSTLTTELPVYMDNEGFEPSTPCLQSRRSPIELIALVVVHIPSWVRTNDLSLRRAALFPLSYRDPVRKEGFEPPTPWV